jgi:4-carboxymuconolactone decarboxylase
MTTTVGGSPNYSVLPLRSSADTAGSASDILRKLESDGDDLEILRLMANSSVMFRPFVSMSAAIMRRSALPPRLRELVILRLASKMDASYEFAQHARIGAAVGVKQAEIASLRSGGGAPSTIRDDERLALDLVDELIDTRHLSHELWGAAVTAFGVEPLLELLVVVGYFGGLVPLLLGALGLEADDGTRSTRGPDVATARGASKHD